MTHPRQWKVHNFIYIEWTIYYRHTKTIILLLSVVSVTPRALLTELGDLQHMNKVKSRFWPEKLDIGQPSRSHLLDDTPFSRWRLFELGVLKFTLPLPWWGADFDSELLSYKAIR